MRIAYIKKYDMVNSFDGAVISIWMQGCPHHCKGCFNPETWNENGGTEYSDEEINKVLQLLKNSPYIKGVSFLGGEPFAPYNIYKLTQLLEEIKWIRPNAIISVWTGYKIEEIIEKKLDRTHLNMIEYIVDGQFIESLKDKRLKFRGSSNQRIFHNVDGSFIDITNERGGKLD